MIQQTIDFLAANIDIWERQKLGNYKHLNQRELDGLMAAAKDIDGDDTPLSPWCHDCRIKLIKKVFEAYELRLSYINCDDEQCDDEGCKEWRAANKKVQTMEYKAIKPKAKNKN
jgi:hypothetical protein